MSPYPWWSAVHNLQTILDGARISKDRRRQLEALIADLERDAERDRWDAARNRTLIGDLRAHLRDRDRHIANLEAQLMPLLRAGAETEQEAMTL